MGSHRVPPMSDQHENDRLTLLTLIFATDERMISYDFYVQTGGIQGEVLHTYHYYRFLFFCWRIFFLSTTLFPPALEKGYHYHINHFCICIRFLCPASFLTHCSHDHISSGFVHPMHPPLALLAMDPPPRNTLFFDTMCRCPFMICSLFLFEVH